MMLLIIAIILLSVSILLSRQFLIMKEWFLWACMLVETFMKGVAESRKLKVLKIAGKKHFRFSLLFMPDCIFRFMISRIENDLKSNYHSLKYYNRLVQGIALYDKDYAVLINLIEEADKREKT